MTNLLVNLVRYVPFYSLFWPPVEHALEKIALTQVDGVGPITSRQLISYLGGVKEVFKAKKKELLAIPGIGEKTIESIAHHTEIFKRAEEEL